MTVLGRPAGSAELRHRVGYVTQDPTIYNDLRIIDNVRYFGALYGTDAQAADEAVVSCRPRGSPNRIVRQPFRRSTNASLIGLRAGVTSRTAGA